MAQRYWWNGWSGMDLDVVLVNPGSRRDVYQGLGEEFSAIEPPSLAALFATYLRRRGQSVEMIDAPAMNWGPAEVAGAVAYLNPVLVVLVVYGFQPSASTQNMDCANETAREIRKQAPQAKIIFTGTHPAALPRRTLVDEPAIDFVCDGEGPRTITQLVPFLKAERADFGLVPGLWYRMGDMILSSPGASLLLEETLNTEMAGGAWDLLPMKRYRAHNWHAFENIEDRQPYASIHTSLGCPYRCTFCCINAPFGKSSYRMWSPDCVIEELDLLVHKYGVRNVKFVDEMFVLNRAHVLGICDRIKDRGLGDSLNIWAYARVDTVKDEFLDRLRESGFRWLALGIESASKHVRDGVEKGRFGSEEILKVVRKVQAAGVNVIGNYIFGLPDDTDESMRDTLSLAKEANCEFANFYSAMAYPGSKLYTLALEKGWRLPERWIGYSQHSYDTTPLPTQTLTGAEVLAFRDNAFREYFYSQSYVDMVRRKFGEGVVENIGRMLSHKMPRRLLEVA